MIVVGIDPGVKCSAWCFGIPGQPPMSGHTAIAKDHKPWGLLFDEARLFFGRDLEIGKEIVDPQGEESDVRVFVEEAWVGSNAAAALWVARVLQIWLDRPWTMGIPAELMNIRSWQAMVGNRKKIGEVEWEAALARFGEELGGTWGDPILKGHGKKKVQLRCPDEYSARGIWAKACQTLTIRGSEG